MNSLYKMRVKNALKKIIEELQKGSSLTMNQAVVVAKGQQTTIDHGTTLFYFIKQLLEEGANNLSEESRKSLDSLEN